MIRHILPLGVLAVLSGCASIVTGQNQNISVTTAPESGATCELQNNDGVWFVNPTPGSVMVSRAYSPLAVTCRKGANWGTTHVSSKTKGMAFGNVLAGGVIGAAIDSGTGAAYDYPETVLVTLSPQGTVTDLRIQEPAVPEGKENENKTKRKN